MVKIRLTRLGKHKNPFYRIITTDSRNKRDGAFLNLLGTYEPFNGKIKIDEQLTLKVLSEGAQPSETILNMLKEQGIWAKHQATKHVKVKKPRKLSKKRKAAKVESSKRRKEAKAKPKTASVKPAPAEKKE